MDSKKKKTCPAKEVEEVTENYAHSASNFVKSFPEEHRAKAAEIFLKMRYKIFEPDIQRYLDEFFPHWPMNHPNMEQGLSGIKRILDFDRVDRPQEILDYLLLKVFRKDSETFKGSKEDPYKKAVELFALIEEGCEKMGSSPGTTKKEKVESLKRTIIKLKDKKNAKGAHFEMIVARDEGWEGAFQVSMSIKIDGGEIKSKFDFVHDVVSDTGVRFIECKNVGVRKDLAYDYTKRILEQIRILKDGDQWKHYRVAFHKAENDDGYHQQVARLLDDLIKASRGPLSVDEKKAAKERFDRGTLQKVIGHIKEDVPGFDPDNYRPDPDKENPFLELARDLLKVKGKKRLGLDDQKAKAFLDAFKEKFILRKDPVVPNYQD